MSFEKTGIQEKMMEMQKNTGTDIDKIDFTAETTTEIMAVTDHPYTNLIALAVEKGTDIEQLGKLMDLEDRWDKKQAHKLFLAAMSKFQSQVPVIFKKGRADFGMTKAGKAGSSYDYAKLEDITEGIKPYLIENELSYRWSTSSEAGIITVTCTISHSAGHSESSSFSSIPDSTGSKNAIQSSASAMSYLKRYTLTAVAGVTISGDDDDAHVPADMVTVDQARILKDMLKTSNSDVKKFCEILSVTDIDSLPAEKYAQAERMLIEKLARNVEPGK